MKKETTQVETEYKAIIAALQKAADGGAAYKRRQLARIASETGFSSKWLSLMAAESIDDAGFKKVTQLSLWLSRNGYLSNNNKQPATHTPADSCSPDFGATESGVCAFQDSAF